MYVTHNVVITVSIVSNLSFFYQSEYIYLLFFQALFGCFIFKVAIKAMVVNSDSWRKAQHLPGDR